MPSREPLTDAQDAALRTAISEITHGAMVTRYVVVAETIDPDNGEQLLEDIAPENQPLWDCLGLLDFYAANWRAHAARAGNED